MSRRRFVRLFDASNQRCTYRDSNCASTFRASRLSSFNWHCWKSGQIRNGNFALETTGAAEALELLGFTGVARSTLPPWFEALPILRLERDLLLKVADDSTLANSPAAPWPNSWHSRARPKSRFHWRPVASWMRTNGPGSRQHLRWRTATRQLRSSRGDRRESRGQVRTRRNLRLPRRTTREVHQGRFRSAFAEYTRRASWQRHVRARRRAVELQRMDEAHDLLVAALKSARRQRRDDGRDESIALHAGYLKELVPHAGRLAGDHRHRAWSSLLCAPGSDEGEACGAASITGLHFPRTEATMSRAAKFVERWALTGSR